MVHVLLPLRAIGGEAHNRLRRADESSLSAVRDETRIFFRVSNGTRRENRRFAGVSNVPRGLPVLGETTCSNCYETSHHTTRT